MRPYQGRTPGAADEGQPQNPRQRQATRVAELFQTKRHSEMPFVRAGLIGAEEAIPPGQVEPEVAIGLWGYHRMVNAVHVGGNHNPAEKALDQLRHAHVAVVEHGRGIEEDFKDQNCTRRCPQKDNDR